MFFDSSPHFRELAADETLGGENGIARIGDGLTLGGLADEALTGLGEGDNRRRGACTFRIGDAPTGSPPSMTAIQELVVPRSMPRILLICIPVSNACASRSINSLNNDFHILKIDRAKTLGQPRSQTKPN